MTSRVFAPVKNFLSKYFIRLSLLQTNVLFCLLFLQIARGIFYATFAPPAVGVSIFHLWMRGLQFDVMMICFSLIPYFIGHVGYRLFSKEEWLHVTLLISHFLLLMICVFETVDQLCYYLFEKGIYLFVFNFGETHILIKLILMVLTIVAFIAAYKKSSRIVNIPSNKRLLFLFVILLLGCRGTVTALPLTELAQLSTVPRLHRLTINGAYVFTWSWERRSQGLPVSPKLEPMIESSHEMDSNSDDSTDNENY